MKIKTNFIRLATICAGLAIVAGTLSVAGVRAQDSAPKFEVDPLWPKPLPNLWVTGGVGGLVAHLAA